MTLMPHDNDAPAARFRFMLWLGLITVFAWLLREYFVLATVVEVPIRGDVRDYVAYAWNLLEHGTFSHTWPGSDEPVADAYRGPGYPLFLALWMALSSEPDGWYWPALHAQAVIGASTVAATGLMARQWLSQRWSLLAALLLALWPHHIAASGALLSEVVLGFALILSLLLTALAAGRNHMALAIAGGAAFSFAYLISPITLFFPLLAAAVIWRDGLPRVASAMLVVSLIAPALWGLRNSTVVQPHGEPGRVEMNFVQGSWPTYHRAYISRGSSPIPDEIMQAIDSEIGLLAADRSAGMRKIRERLAYQPGYYLRWYFLEKPYLLWDWDIRMGAGDVYFHRLSHSPLERNPVLHAIKQLLKALNPVIFALSAVAALALLYGGWRKRPWAAQPAVLVAAFCVYVTALHMVFQAEPRYAIPYRPMQMLMLVTMLALIARWKSRRFSKSGSVRSPHTP